MGVLLVNFIVIARTFIYHHSSVREYGLSIRLLNENKFKYELSLYIQ